MLKNFIVTVYCEDNGRKIFLIKELRAALGIGLTEAKKMSEDCQYTSCDYILNATQVANLVVASLGSCGGGYDCPTVCIRKVVPCPTTSARDFSSSTPY